MKELLVIRSVSFQQLDLNLLEIQKKFPGSRISLLTHEHGVKLAEKYNDIDQIYVYPYEGSFNKKYKVLELEGKSFDAIIIPVTNITGCSFLNVLAFGLGIKSKKYYMCNVISEIQEITRMKITMEKIRGNVYKILAAILTIPIVLASLVYLPFKLKSLERE